MAKSKLLPVLLLLSATSAYSQEIIHIDYLPSECRIDSLLLDTAMHEPYGFLRRPDDYAYNPDRLNEDDYREIAEKMGVEIAAIKAVVDIEAGTEHKGFWTSEKPLINFDLSIYNRIAPRHGVNLSQARKTSPEIFSAPDRNKYGSYQAAQQARLDAAIEIDEESALKSTFWGMFQIGGFNYARCGIDSVQEFVKIMSRSERDQLELFAEFCNRNNLTKYIRNKDWAGFSYRYNGPGYKSRRYDSRMAAAYRKYSRQSQPPKKEL